MANKQEYYFSKTQAKRFAAYNAAGGRLFVQPSGRGGFRKFYYKAFFNGKLYTQSTVSGDKPDPAYSDWVLVGSGTPEKVQLTTDLF